MIIVQGAKVIEISFISISLMSGMGLQWSFSVNLFESAAIREDHKSMHLGSSETLLAAAISVSLSSKSYSQKRLLCDTQSRPLLRLESLCRQSCPMPRAHLLTDAWSNVSPLVRLQPYRVMWPYNLWTARQDDLPMTALANRCNCATVFNIYQQQPHQAK